MDDITIVRVYDPQERAGAVRIGDFELVSTNYDATGWGGLFLLEQLANNLAKYFGVTVTMHDKLDE